MLLGALSDELADAWNKYESGKIADEEYDKIIASIRARQEMLSKEIKANK